MLDMLPPEGEAPFIAALPKAALANREGPLAVLGHIDAAWTMSYSMIPGVGANPSERFLKIPGALTDLEAPARAGAAFGAFTADMPLIDRGLTELYAAEAKAKLSGRALPVDRGERAMLWLLRQDLGAYLLLGDPAVRLPLAARG